MGGDRVNSVHGFALPQRCRQIATVLAADCGRVSNPRHAKCVHIISELAVLARQRRLGRSDLHRRLMAFLWRANADYLRSRSALSAKTRGDCTHRFGPPHWRISAVYRMDVDECDAGGSFGLNALAPALPSPL